MRKALYILADLDDTDVRWLVENGRRRFVSGGETIIAEGEPIDTLYIVVAGELAVTTRAGMLVAKLATGDIVGEMSLIEKRPPAASVTALGEAEVLCVPQAAIRARIQTETAFAARFYRALAVFLSDRLRTAVSRLGYSNGERDVASEAENELDEGVLDTLHVAGDRMRRMLALLDGRNNVHGGASHL
jgi:CRP-like cAMP-binding protein